MPFLKLGFLVLLALLSNPNRLNASSIGVNYGLLADNLPPPLEVATFIKTKTTFNRVKLFDANPDILRAFSNTGISVTITVVNSLVLSLATLSSARSWVAANIIPFHPQTLVDHVLVGNEVLATHDRSLIAHTLPAMKAINAALHLANLTTIKVSTPHSLGILSSSEPPSSGRFRKGYDRSFFRPMLQFLRETSSPFVVNPYPYFGFKAETLNYALFKLNKGFHDATTGKSYTNMFDAQLDAVYSAMKKLGYSDVDIVVGETGWPWAGDLGQAGVSLENALSYNGNLVKHVASRKGTPLMPNKTFVVYIFSLFNEDLKPSVSERSFGLFNPDFSPVYDAGVMINEPWKEWCVPRIGASDEALQRNLDFVCGSGVNCTPIQVGGWCFTPNTVLSHAGYAMNAYYQKFGHSDFNCNFGNTGVVTSTDPSYGPCKYPSNEQEEGANN